MQPETLHFRKRENAMKGKPTLVLVTLSLAFGLGCDSGTDIDCQTINKDVIYGNLYDIQMENLALIQENGWKCDGGEPLYNAFGNRFGTRYICKTC